MSRFYKREKVYWYDFRMHGVRYRKSTGKTKRREAEAVLDSEREKAKVGKCVGVQKIKDCTVAVLASEYSKWVKFGYNFKKSQHCKCPKSLVEMVGATGFEPATS